MPALIFILKIMLPTVSKYNMNAKCILADTIASFLIARATNMIYYIIKNKKQKQQKTQ